MNINGLYEDYRREGIFFVVTGPSGVGKTTLMEKLLGRDEGLSYSVSHTTRKQRPNETDGEDYYFVGEKEFFRIKDDGGFLEWAEIYGDYYGTSRGEIERIRASGLDPFLDIDVQGAEQVRNNSAVDAVFIFIAPPSLKELETRIDNRGAEGSESRKKRLNLARDELTRIPDFDYLIVNQDLEQATDDLESVIRAERIKI
ncbi:guanylate kinase [Candidatus Bipolaricaulota bacterium]|nr:guanylate kinase [Candidatus Bipolaricaulota bacterium]MBS3813988.1 guanylate kinase [Candidatus Bipolaricaulota bacterium]MBS3825119.1 guanylate kinase [Candidatus Bipolaricaulota bacterium]